MVSMTYTLSWQQPSIAAHLTTGYNLICVPLLAGIPVPQSLWLPPTTTSVTVTGLRPGVSYNCTIFTITDQGSSSPLTFSVKTSETGKHCREESIGVLYITLNLLLMTLHVLYLASVYLKRNFAISSCCLMFNYHFTLFTFYSLSR